MDLLQDSRDYSYTRHRSRWRDILITVLEYLGVSVNNADKYMQNLHINTRVAWVQTIAVIPAHYTELLTHKKNLLAA